MGKQVVFQKEAEFTRMSAELNIIKFKTAAQENLQRLTRFTETQMTMHINNVSESVVTGNDHHLRGKKTAVWDCMWPLI